MLLNSTIPPDFPTALRDSIPFLGELRTRIRQCKVAKINLSLPSKTTIEVAPPGSPVFGSNFSLALRRAVSAPDALVDLSISSTVILL